jgi:hypothetical protein
MRVLLVDSCANESVRLLPWLKRLQVILQDPEYREIQRVARSRRMSLAEWVRQALEAARREEPTGSIGRKLDAVRLAARHEFPAGDIDQMLAGIEAGYTSGTRS